MASSVRLAVGAGRHGDVAPERPGALDHVELRLEHLPARLDQLGVERRVLAGGVGQVPAVDEHVDEAGARSTPRREPARTRPRTVAPSHPARGTPPRPPRPSASYADSGSGSSTSPSRRSPTSSIVLPAHELGHPEVAAHDVVQERPDASSRRTPSRVELARVDPRHEDVGPIKGTGVDLGQVDDHRAPPRTVGTGATLTNRRPGGGARPPQHRPSMKIHDRRWIALGPYAAQRVPCGPGPDTRRSTRSRTPGSARPPRP